MDGVQLPQGESHFEEAVYSNQIGTKKSVFLSESTKVAILDSVFNFCLAFIP